MNFLFVFLINTAAIKQILGNDIISGQNEVNIADFENLLLKINELNEKVDDEQAKQLGSLIAPLLLAECKMMKSNDKTVKNNGDDSVEIYLEVYKHCEALKKGQFLDSGISEEFANKVEKALQKHSQKLVEFFKKRENEAKITVDGKCGTIADILARADEHPKLRQIVKMFDILRKWVGKMGAGPDKEAIQNVLLASHSVPMPSDMVKLVIQLWHSSKFGAVPQQLRAIKCPSRSRRRRKRQNCGDFSPFGVVMFIISACVASYVVELLKNLLEKGNDFLEFRIVSISVTIFIYAFIRQQPIFKLGAKFIAGRIIELWNNLTGR